MGDHTPAGPLRNVPPPREGEKLSESFAAGGLRLFLRVPAPSLEAFARCIRGLSRGGVVLQRIESPLE
jgi:hypothetical protein